MHLRCRCAIIYDEVAEPRGKPNKPNDLPRGLAAGNAIYVNEGGRSPYIIGAIDVRDANQVKQVLDWAEARIVKAPIENAIIITKTGDIYHCTGDLNTLNPIVELGDELRGAIVTHNHPKGSDNEYSFSNADENLFINFELARLRGIDERFVYEFNRNSEDIDAVVLLSEANEFNSRHSLVVELARKLGIGYRRWAR